ncbi:MAG: LytR C-terminal domain-containing protein [candidate division Zixibacteria bacterium]|nr:LytR C-terminal domain-containing protein [candidate division Zixibacteria bacterium]MDH3935971.1 LytR C-terminal domain-containing protein [candidate division Zixibacteria bacterium]MDH4035333.1 LytR C-terminal domain-containing protein [candidate division Zixibacteria bacterium]
MYKSSKPQRTDGANPVSWRQRVQRSRLLELSIAAVFVIVLVYVVSMSIRVSQGVSRTLGSPEHVVRLQILNGCGVTGLASRLADGLSNYADDDLEIRVVDTDNFEVSTVRQTFMLSRDEDVSIAGLLAVKLGLPADEIGCRPLENNYRQVSVTLVLGEDWETIDLLKNHVKEK